MFKKYHILFMGIFNALDILFTVVALYIADLGSRYFLHQGGDFFPPPHFDRLAYFLAIIIWMSSFRAFPIYSSKRAEPLVNELILVGLAGSVSWFLFLGALFLFGYPSTTRLPAVYFGVLDLTLLIIFHICLRAILRFIRSRGYNLKKVLIVGAGHIGQQIASVLIEHPWTGFKVVGFLDDDPSIQGRSVLSIPVLGTLDKIREVVSTLEFHDEVIIALPPNHKSNVQEIIPEIEDIPVNVRVTPDLYTPDYIRPHVEDLWGIPLLGIRQSGITTPYAAAKRLIDIFGALFFLILFSPLMLLAAILIKLDDKGSILFIQQRVGENGKIFRMYKFRTMIDGSEEMLPELVDFNTLEEPVFKIKNDPRVTRAGHFLRRTSIDEIPQFLNVLKGEMSLVGPRPEAAVVVQRYNSWHRKRLLAKPGLTGPAQVTGRADLPLRERVQLEIDYINNYSFLIDVEILLKTIPVVIKGDGCY
jgi:exopolysaccharide biosynthesis polyprenyl glycosylphosphotransferase